MKLFGNPTAYNFLCNCLNHLSKVDNPKILMYLQKHFTVHYIDILKNIATQIKQ